MVIFPILLLVTLGLSLGVIQFLFQLLDLLQSWLYPSAELILLGIGIIFGLWCFGES
ncbi:MAG: hypothetical protein ACO4CG_16465 [Prochlorothrix sp.]